jgi:hypothetical protein
MLSSVRARADRGDAGQLHVHPAVPQALETVAYDSAVARRVTEDP